MTPRSLASLCALLGLAACSQAPGFGDASSSDGDATAPEASPVDTGRDAPLEAGDAGADAPDVQVLDVVDVVDVLDARDVGPEGVDVVDVRDAPADVPADVVGPRPDLAAMYTSERFELLYRATCSSAGCTPLDRDRPGPGTSCTFSGGRINVFVETCGGPMGFGCDSMTGFVYPRPDAGTPFFSFETGGPPSIPADAVRVAQSAVYVAGGVARQNFHVQFTATASSGRRGATGIPGRTVDPTLGDLWLLGCRSTP